MTPRARLAIVAAALALVALIAMLREEEGSRTARATQSAEVEAAAPAVAPRRGSSGARDGTPGSRRAAPAADADPSPALPNAPALTLRVVAEGTGTALSGARVEFRSLGEAFQGSGATGTDGRVRFPGAPEEAFVVDAFAPADWRGQLRGAREVVRGLGPHEIRLRAGHALTVRVRDETGAIPDEPVHAFWQTLEESLGAFGADRGCSCALDEDGIARFALPERPVGVGVSALAGSSLTYVWTAPVDPTAGELSVVVYHGKPVRFRVVDAETGEWPTGGMLHYWLCRAGGPCARSCAHGTGDGESRPLAPGRYDLYAMLLGGRTGDEVLAWGETRGVSPGAQPVVVVVERSGRIAGHVRGPDGRPPPEPVRVRMSLDEEGAIPDGGRTLGGTWTDATGSFVFQGVPPCPVRVELGSSTTLVAEPLRGVVAGDRNLELVATRAVSVRGRIVWGDWAGPLGGYVGATRWRSARLQEDGTFELNGLRPGPVRLGWWTCGSKIADLGEVVAPAEGVLLRAAAP